MIMWRWDPPIIKEKIKSGSRPGRCCVARARGLALAWLGWALVEWPVSLMFFFSLFYFFSVFKSDLIFGIDLKTNLFQK
jgi:hypothetical protein